ncbi:hypothetical protein HK100_010651 [Physocladia obscura]|uniref:Uncharacterized protein n=1 Tax=Physocladia obscura TaxID=109957 RepID=A0AAD5SSD8_9FUNG|nr:hypothetical protein HK100_010651 [Physocladia obscura]
MLYDEHMEYDEYCRDFWACVEKRMPFPPPPVFCVEDIFAIQREDEKELQTAKFDKYDQGGSYHDVHDMHNDDVDKRSMNHSIDHNSSGKTKYSVNENVAIQTIIRKDTIFLTINEMISEMTKELIRGIINEVINGTTNAHIPITHSTNAAVDTISVKNPNKEIISTIKTSIIFRTPRLRVIIHTKTEIATKVLLFPQIQKTQVVNEIPPYKFNRVVFTKYKEAIKVEMNML